MKEIYYVKNGIHAYTSHVIGGNAFIIVEAQVQNDSDKDADLWLDIHMHQLIDKGAEQIDEVPGVMATGHVKLHVAAGGIGRARTQICLENAKMWSPKEPNLYVVESVLYKPVPEGEALPNPKLMAGLAMREPHSMKMADFIETRFGVRTVAADSTNGFTVNGEPVELKSIDYTDSAEVDFDTVYKKLRALKDTGYNSILVDGTRASAHLLDCCDRLGLVAIDMISDTATVVRDRNHPALMAWELHGSCLEDKQMVRDIRAMDTTRPVGGVCGVEYGMEEDHFDARAWYDNTEEVCAAWDYVGYPADKIKKEPAKILFANRLMVSLR